MKHKVKVKKKSKSGQGRSIGSAEYSVLGALNEDKYRAPVEIMAAAKAVMLASDRSVPNGTDQFETTPEVTKAVKKMSKRKVKVKK